MLKKYFLDFIDGAKFYMILACLLIANLIFGFIYLNSLIEKIKLNDYNNQLIKKNQQINSDISRIKLKIDEKIDLLNVDKISREKLNMVDIENVNYIIIEKE